MVNPFAASLMFALKITAFAETPAEAKDLGTHGVIYPIDEEDPIALIQSKLKAMEETGELIQHNAELGRKAKAGVERPAPVRGITKAAESRIFYFDPSYVILNDFQDHRGQVLAKKGTKINPLKTVSLSTDLLFFDGDDEEQVDWIKAHLQDQNPNVNLILIKGAPLALSEELKGPVYFDQGGILTQKLGVRHVPALVSQEGYLLRIEEIPLSRKEQ